MLLHRLRESLGEFEDRLSIDRKKVQWILKDGDSIDIEQFKQLTTHPNPEAWSQALALYKGELVPGCDDIWLIPIREMLFQTFLDTTGSLLENYEQKRHYKKAISLAKQRLQTETFESLYYHDLMRLYALNQEPNEAIRIYHQYCKILEENLGVEPEESIEDFYFRLKNLKRKPKQTDLAKEQMLGLERPWEILQKTWHDLTVSKARVVVVEGEFGLGKSKLLRSFSDWVSAQGITSLFTSCYPMEKDFPYAAIVSWLRSLPLPSVKKVWKRELARILPELLESLEDEEPLTPLENIWEKHRLNEAISKTIIRFDEPLLLVLDNLQWCDAESLRFLHSFIVRFAANRSILLLTATRPIASQQTLPNLSSQNVQETIHTENATLKSFLQGISSNQQMISISLEPLQPSVTAQFAQQNTNTRLSPLLTQRLHQETNGVPMLILERLRTENWQDNLKTHSAPLPNNPSQAVLSGNLLRLELDNSSSRTLTFVKLAAVFGKTFSFSSFVHAVQQLTLSKTQAQTPNPPYPQEDVMSQIQIHTIICELLGRNILKEYTPGRFDFQHDRTREIAYNLLTPEEKITFHHFVADALVHELPRNPELRNAEIAFHWEKAQQSEKARPLFLKAAKEAAACYVHTEAEQFYLKFFELTKERDRDYYTEWLAYIQATVTGQGQYKRAKPLLQNMIRETAERGFIALQGQTLLCLGSVLHWLGESEDAEKILLQATHILVKLEKKPEEARSNTLLGILCSERGSYDEAQAFFEKALEQRKALNDQKGEALVLGCMAMAFIEQHALDRAQSCLEKILLLEECSKNLRIQARTWGNLGAIYSEKGEYQRASFLFQKALQANRKTGMKHSEAIVLYNNSFSEFKQKNYREAFTLCTEAHVLFEELGLQRNQAYAYLTFGMIHRDQAKFEDAFQSFEKGFHIAKTLKDKRLDICLLLARSALYRYQHKTNQAHQDWQQAFTLQQTVNHPQVELECLCEEGFQQLAKGQDISKLLQKLERLQTQGIQYNAINEQILLLQWAAEAQKQGETLYCGQRAQDLPAAIQKTLIEKQMIR